MTGIVAYDPYRPTCSAGSHRPMMQTLDLVSMARAALKWTSGRPTQSPRPSLLTRAVSAVRPSAPAQTVVMAPLDTAVCATRTAVTSTLTAWGTKISLAPEKQLILAKK